GVTVEGAAVRDDPGVPPDLADVAERFTVPGDDADCVDSQVHSLQGLLDEHDLTGLTHPVGLAENRGPGLLQFACALAEADPVAARGRARLYHDSAGPQLGCRVPGILECPGLVGARMPQAGRLEGLPHEGLFPAVAGSARVVACNTDLGREYVGRFHP